MGPVLLDQLARDEPLAGTPDEIHLSVCRAQRQSRLEDQEHAAIKKKERADQSHRHWNPGAASAEKRNHTDGHTRRHEHSDREIERRQRALQQTRAARQFIELIEEHRPSLFEKIDLRIAARKLLQTIRQRPDAIYYSAQPAGGRQDHGAAGRDQYGGRNHGSQNRQ